MPLTVNKPCKNVGVENTGESWHKAQAERIGRAVAARRKQLGMTGQQLAARCAELGAPIHRTTITKIEKGRPRFDLGELMVLAAALDTSPVALVYPGPYDESVDVVPVLKVSELVAAEWFSALGYLALPGEYEEMVSEVDRWRDATTNLRLWRVLNQAVTARSAAIAASESGDAVDGLSSPLIAMYDSQIREFRELLGLSDG